MTVHIHGIYNAACNLIFCLKEVRLLVFFQSFIYDKCVTYFLSRLGKVILGDSNFIHLFRQASLNDIWQVEITETKRFDLCCLILMNVRVLSICILQRYLHYLTIDAFCLLNLLHGL